MSKAVMTIHGFLTGVEDFGVLYNYLSDYDEVVKCKIPGHDEKVDYKLFKVVPTLSQVLKTYDDLKSRHDTVDVVGFSMGGALTSWLCTQRKVNKAVFVAASNKYFNFGSLFAMLKFYYETYADAYHNSVGETSQRLRWAESAIQPHTQNSALSLRIAIRRMLPNINIATYSTFKNLMQRCNEALDMYNGLYGKITTPSLILWGVLDELVPKSSVEHLQKYLADCQTIIYKDVGHAMLMTNRGPALSKDIMAFLNK